MQLRNDSDLTVLFFLHSNLMEGNFESFPSLLLMFGDGACDAVPTLVKKEAMPRPRGRLAALELMMHPSKQSLPATHSPFAPCLKNCMLTGETQLTLVECNKRLGVIDWPNTPQTGSTHSITGRKLR